MLSCDWLQHHDDADRGDRGVPGGGAAAVHHDRAAHHLLQVRAAAARQAGLMFPVCSVPNDFLDYNLVGNITLFINVIICLSYPLNFAIYCGMSR